MTGWPWSYRSWSDWAIDMQARELLTIGEVLERLMLEYQLGRVFGTIPRR